jgi:MFS family permease
MRTLFIVDISTCRKYNLSIVEISTFLEKNARLDPHPLTVLMFITGVHTRSAPMDKTPAIGRNVVLTGFTSFFTDISSEMIYPLLQSFVQSLLRGQQTLVGPVLGIIEGTAESTASLLKVLSGYRSDRTRKRKPLAISGYSLSTVSKLIYLVPSWPAAFAARFLDRVGKGIRTAPRDALIAESAGAGSQGKAFGFQRAMDFAGAFLGTAVAYVIVRYLFPGAGSAGDPKLFTPVFLIAVAPALVGVLFLFFLKEEGRQTDGVAKAAGAVEAASRKGGFSPGLRIFLVSQLLFTLGNSSNQFLLLRSGSLGYALPVVLLMYILFNLASSLLSTFFGSLSDRTGRKTVLLIGYGLYAAVYLAFGFITPEKAHLLWVFWPVYGVYYALTEGVEKAFVSDMAPKESKATMLGLYNTVVGIGLLPASVVAGFLFRYKPWAPFAFGGAMACASMLILGFFVREDPALKRRNGA